MSDSVLIADAYMYKQKGRHGRQGDIDTGGDSDEQWGKNTGRFV